MLLSVIIPTFNRADVLPRTLNLLTTQTLPAADFEVIIVDDGSTDDTPAILKNWRRQTDLQLQILTQKNAGAGAARNRALDAARGAVLLFLGDDMLPLPDCLAAHAHFHAAHSQKEKAALGFVRWHPDLPRTRYLRWLETSGTQFRFHDLAAGQRTDFWRFYTANLSVKRAFLAAERFDTSFTGWGFEDIELGYRLSRRGLDLRYLPAAVVEHLHPQSPADLGRRMQAAGRNAAHFERLHPGVGAVPRGAKKWAQLLLAYAWPFTFWARSKRAFCAGVRRAA